jgi:hypothetical protein
MSVRYQNVQWSGIESAHRLRALSSCETTFCSASVPTKPSSLFDLRIEYCFMRVRSKRGRLGMKADDCPRGVGHDVMEFDEHHKAGNLRWLTRRLDECFAWIRMFPILIIDFEWQINVDASLASVR